MFDDMDWIVRHIMERQFKSQVRSYLRMGYNLKLSCQLNKVHILSFCSEVKEGIDYTISFTWLMENLYQ
jgi:hypothetical protein